MARRRIRSAPNQITLPFEAVVEADASSSADVEVSASTTDTDSDPSLSDRIHGALIGLACGDALGA
ncbi:MAG: hypothetical protein AAGD38_19280, partial [Acidobacteriota bacterium]